MSLRVGTTSAWRLLLPALVALCACGARTAILDDGGYGDGDGDADSDSDTDVDADADADTDADTESDADGDEDVPLDCPPGVEVPTEEICWDGVDNDCDGLESEGCDPEPPGCLCIPGAERWCDTPDYSLWGQQTCDEDGLSWGYCWEGGMPPAECAVIDGWFSPAFEECMVRHGECIQDMWDQDCDGDNWESLGDCVDIVCDPSGTCRVCEDGCTECVPDWQRFCDVPAYSRVGIQTCHDDGEWGPCLEIEGIPPECLEDHWYSPAWEACCVEHGWCCQDMWDQDRDGDTWESLGVCGC